MINSYICYTYGGDADKTIEAVTSLRQLDTWSLIHVLDDAHHPMSLDKAQALSKLGCRVLQTSFPRRGNLRGFDCAREMVRELVMLSRHADVVIKFDPDVIFKSVAWIDAFYQSGRPVGGIRSRCGRAICGGCYAVRSDFAEALFHQYFLGVDPPYLTEEDYELCNRACLAAGKPPHEVFWQLGYAEAGTPTSYLVQIHSRDPIMTASPTA